MVLNSKEITNMWTIFVSIHTTAPEIQIWQLLELNGRLVFLLFIISFFLMSNISDISFYVKNTRRMFYTTASQTKHSSHKREYYYRNLLSP